MTTYQSRNFDLIIKQLNDRVVITQRVYHPSLYTDSLPGTTGILKQLLPTIFCNECFNDRKVTFGEEVKSTEVAHLFEHILLEKLKLLKLAECGEADFSGETSWDWDKSPKGTFEICINSCVNNNRLFDIALTQAILIMDQIFELNVPTVVN